MLGTWRLPVQVKRGLHRYMSRAHTGLVLHCGSRHNGQCTDFRTILENRCTCAGEEDGL